MAREFQDLLSMQQVFRQARKAVCNRYAKIKLQPSVPHVPSAGQNCEMRKSCAQVETSVSPQAVSPKSCALKRGFHADNHSKQKRKNPLTVRLSDQERTAIHDKARRAGCTTNAYIRASVLGSTYQAPLNHELRARLLELFRELTRQGNNLNQIAKHLNANTTADKPQGESMLERLGQSLLATHRAIRQALTQGRPAP